MTRPTGHTAVMASRTEAPDALDFFPTPPWATRALIEHVIPSAGGHCWEPACGEGHMSAVLAETFEDVLRSDVHDYGCNHATGSFVGTGPDVVAAPQPAPDWIITNPPFALAVEFAERALTIATAGVALLLRTSWLEGADRWQRIFRHQPPSIVAPFVERVPMVKGRWDPDASTATAYAWFVWIRGAQWDGTRLVWIPPGCRASLTRPDDRARFAAGGQAGSSLLDGMH